MAELLARCSASELTEWAAYERIAGPLGAERGDVQAAIVASTIANVNRGKKSRRFMPKDFIPRWDRSGSGARTPEAMRNMLIAMTRRLGGKVLDRGDSR
ncbi:MAG: phage tail assembly protein T [Candidatus Rokuibacteriota bacterium]